MRAGGALDLGREIFENSVELVLAGRRIEGVRIDEEIDVLGEAGDQAPTLGEAGATLEHRPLAELGSDNPQDLGDVVVLLDELLAEIEVRRRAQDRLREVLVLEEPHFACQSRAKRRSLSVPKSKRLSGLRLARSRLRSCGGAPSSSPSAPSIARTRGGS